MHFAVRGLHEWGFCVEDFIQAISQAVFKIRAIVGEVQNLFCFEPVCTMVNSRIERGRKEGPHIIDTRLNSC